MSQHQFWYLHVRSILSSLDTHVPVIVITVSQGLVKVGLVFGIVPAIFPTGWFIIFVLRTNPHNDDHWPPLALPPATFCQHLICAYRAVSAWCSIPVIVWFMYWCLMLMQRCSQSIDWKVWNHINQYWFDMILTKYFNLCHCPLS